MTTTTTRRKNPKVYPCAGCHKRFTTIYGRDLHEERQHGSRLTRERDGYNSQWMNRGDVGPDGRKVTKEVPFAPKPKQRANVREEDVSGVELKYCPCCGFNVAALRIEEND